MTSKSWTARRALFALEMSDEVPARGIRPTSLIFCSASWTRFSPMSVAPSSMAVLTSEASVGCGSVFSDVAELADAQVSEACDGDIVEVQVLSSAPMSTGPAFAFLLLKYLEQKNNCHGFSEVGVFDLEVQFRKGSI